MIYYLHEWILQWSQGTTWEDALSPIRVFRYISVRSIGAVITAMAFSLILGPRIIAWLKDLKFRQFYADKSEQAGGMVRVTDKKELRPWGGHDHCTMDFAVLLWAQWNAMILLCLLSLIVLSALGFYDDYLKVTRQDADGIQSKVKLLVQLILGASVAIYLFLVPSTRPLIDEIMVPFFFKEPMLVNAPLVGMGLTLLAIMGSSNAVNLTDGLDGLAIGCTLIVTGVFIALTYIAGNVNWSDYLQVLYVSGASELTVFCSAMMGACVGFLWFNCHPAQVFMGDTGSLALGGGIELLPLIHQPLILMIAGECSCSSPLCHAAGQFFKYHKRKTGVGKRIFLASSPCIIILNSLAGMKIRSLCDFTSLLVYSRAWLC